MQHRQPAAPAAAATKQWPCDGVPHARGGQRVQLHLWALCARRHVVDGASAGGGCCVSCDVAGAGQAGTQCRGSGRRQQVYDTRRRMRHALDMGVSAGVVFASKHSTSTLSGRGQTVCCGLPGKQALISSTDRTAVKDLLRLNTVCCCLSAHAHARSARLHAGADQPRPSQLRPRCKAASHSPQRSPTVAAPGNMQACDASDATTSSSSSKEAIRVAVRVRPLRCVCVCLGGWHGSDVAAAATRMHPARDMRTTSLSSRCATARPCILQCQGDSARRPRGMGHRRRRGRGAAAAARRAAERQVRVRRGVRPQQHQPAGACVRCVERVGGVNDLRSSRCASGCRAPVTAGTRACHPRNHKAGV